MPALLNAFFIESCIAVSLIWWRPTFPLRGSTDSLADGKTYCHAHSFPIFGYLRSSASGRYTAPCPAAMSCSCMAFTLSKCSRSRSFTAAGSTVERSLSPLPLRTKIVSASKSMSFTRSRASSIRRRPAPYKSCPIRSPWPERC